MVQLQSVLTTLPYVGTWLGRGSLRAPSVKQNVADSFLAPLDVCRIPSLTPNTPWLSEGYGTNFSCIPSKGKVTAFAFFIEFPDAIDPTVTPQPQYQKLIPDALTWFNSQSLGQFNLNLTADTSIYYRVSGTSASYGITRDRTDANVTRLFQDSLDAFYRLTPWGFPPVDLLYIITTPVADAIQISPPQMQPILRRNGQQVAKQGVIFGHDAGHWGYKVIPHETGHTMCLPDLYVSSGSNAFSTVGGFDLMGNIAGVSPDLLQWHRWKLGWINPQAEIWCVNQKGTRSTYMGTTDGSGVAMIVVKLEERKVLVIEGRGRGKPPGACGNGILLYTVRSDINSGLGPVQVIDTKPNSGGCGGDEKNDAPLNVGPKGQKQSFTTDYHGVIVSVENASITGGGRLLWYVTVQVP